MSDALELVSAVRTVSLPAPSAQAVASALAAAPGLVVFRLGRALDDEARARAWVDALVAGAGAELPRAVLSLARGTPFFDLVRADVALGGAPDVSLALDPRDLLLGYALPFAGVNEVLAAVAPRLAAVRVFDYGFATSEHGDVPAEVFERLPRGIPDVLARVGRSLVERIFDETVRARAGAPLTVAFDAARSPRLASDIRARYAAASRG